MHVFTVGVAVTRDNLTHADALVDYSYVNVSNDNPNGTVVAHCLTGLGPNGTGSGENGLLGGLYFNDTMIPNSGEQALCSSDVIQVRPGGGTAGVIDIHQCGEFTTAVEGIYTCTMINSSMMNQSVTFGVYFTGRSKSVDLYIPSLNHLSSLYAASPVIDPPSSSTVTVTAGFPLSLSCTSRHSPPDTFTWRKDNGPMLQSSTTPVTYNASSAVFRTNYSIDSVNTSDSGTYTCKVTNPIGSDSAIITVVVNGKFLR